MEILFTVALNLSHTNIHLERQIECVCIVTIHIVRLKHNKTYDHLVDPVEHKNLYISENNRNQMFMPPPGGKQFKVSYDVH